MNKRTALDEYIDMQIHALEVSMSSTGAHQGGTPEAWPFRADGDACCIRVWRGEFTAERAELLLRAERTRDRGSR